LSWDAMLKLTEVKLETLSDPTMYSIFERGIRGGVCHVPKRSSEANHEYLESYDPNQPKKYIIYIDANNLYGNAMSEELPTGDFKFASREIIDSLTDINSL